MLAGAALIALPIVLHLIMRREVQRLTFPALRFVQQRRARSKSARDCCIVAMPSHKSKALCRRHKGQFAPENATSWEVV